MIVRVKMIDGRQIEVSVPRDGRIADIADRVLEAEDAPMHKMIRLIYTGRLMLPEDTIAQYNLGPEVVIHAVISDAPFHVPHSQAPQHEAPHGSRPPTGASEEDGRQDFTSRWSLGSGGAHEEPLEGIILKLPPGIILALLWYVFMTRGGDLFSWFSTMSLLILTFLYLCYTLPRSINGPASVLEHAMARLYSSGAPAQPADRNRYADNRNRRVMEAIDINDLHEDVNNPIRCVLFCIRTPAPQPVTSRLPCVPFLCFSIAPAPERVHFSNPPPHPTSARVRV